MSHIYVIILHMCVHAFTYIRTSPSTGEVALPTSERTPSTCPIKILTPVLDFFPGTEFF